jgi:F-type H+-transporting ATPase subunit b
MPMPTLPDRRTLLALAMTLGLLLPALAARAQEEHTHAPIAPAETPAAVDAHSAHGAGEHRAELIPKLEDPDQRREAMLSALWVLIIFFVLLAVLYPTAWKNVLAGLKKREERIRKDIADAEAARLRAEATLRQYTEQIAAAERAVQDMLARATVDGEKIAATLKAQAQKEAEEIRDRANRDIEAARDQALTEIYQRTAELATSIAEKIIRRNLNPADQRDLVNQTLEQLQTVAR